MTMKYDTFIETIYLNTRVCQKVFIFYTDKIPLE